MSAKFQDWANNAAYFIAVAGLIYFMGVERRPAMSAAQTVFSYLFIFLARAFVVRSIKGRQYSFTWLTRPLLRMIESYASITAELTILLATLGILTATFTSRIAEAPFVRTMMVAMVICMPLMRMMGPVFTRPELVVTPGLAQLPAFVLVLIGTLAISFALQGSFGHARVPDILLRLMLAGIAGGAVCHPDNSAAAAFAVPAVVMTLFGVWRYRQYAV